jgi:hypothetical protein
VDPEKRLSAGDALNHTWLTKDKIDITVPIKYANSANNALLETTSPGLYTNNCISTDSSIGYSSSR